MCSPANSRCCGLPRLPPLFPQLRAHQALPRFPLPKLWPKISFKAVSWSNWRTPLICFSGAPSFIACCPCLEKHCLIHLTWDVLVFVCFLVVVSGRRVNLDLLFHLGQIRRLLKKFLTFYFKKNSNFHSSCKNSTMNAYIPFYLDSAIVTVFLSCIISF